MKGDHLPMWRVSRKNPCPVCGRPDWCLLSEDGSAAICPRISEGAVKACGQAGWLHVLRDGPKDPTPRRTRTVRVEADRQQRDFGPWAQECTGKARSRKLGELAKGLGVSVDSLRRLGVGWSDEHMAWAFLMQNASGKVIGVRLRSPGGRKFAVTGSREGLFVPTGLTFTKTMLVCEGPTDTAAMLGLGFEAIGRPSCTGGVKLLGEVVGRQRPPEVVVVADGDGPGMGGAEALASVLVVYCPAVRVIGPPDGLKDARAWVQASATREDVLQTIETAPVRRLKTRWSRR